MEELTRRDIEYTDDSTRMIGYFCSNSGGEEKRPGVFIVHGAFGLAEPIKECADRLAASGYAVLAADLWGDRLLPKGVDEATPLMERLVSDHATWMSRLRAAHALLAAQPEVDAARLAALGYCFGGSSVLEYARVNGVLAGVVSFHGGLDSVSTDWTPNTSASKVLICSGADDPMASPEALLALERAMTEAGVDWEVDIYSGTNHAFAIPGGHNFHAQSAERSWNAMERFFHELFNT